MAAGKCEFENGGVSAGRDDVEVQRPVVVTVDVEGRVVVGIPGVFGPGMPFFGKTLSTMA